MTIPFADGEDRARCMRRLVGLEWRAGIAGSIYGRRIGVRTTREDALALASAALPPGFVEDAGDEPVGSLFSIVSRARRHALYVGPRLLHRATALEPIAGELERHCDVLLALTARDRWFVHAGVVVVNGLAIVLPGASGAGKSSLVHALVERGASYVSDDCAVFDRDGRVHPYARPLTLKAPYRRIAIAGPALEPARVRLVVFTRWQGGSEPVLRPLARGRAVFGMLSHALSTESKPASTLRVLARIARGAKAFEGPRGEAGEMADAILRLS